MSRVGRELRFAGVFKLCSTENVPIVTAFDVSAWGESSGSPGLSNYACWQRR